MNKIVAQAHEEGIPFSAAERARLSFSESDASGTAESAVDHRSRDDASDDEYEEKVAGLLRRAFERDCAQDASATSMYRNAQIILGRGDHYLLVIAERAVGAPSSPTLFGQIARIVSGSLAVLIAGALALVVVAGVPTNTQELVLLVVTAVLVAAGGVHLLRNATRRRV